MGQTSSETLIAKAKAELEEERKVGTGLMELQPKKKKKPQLWPCGQSPSTCSTGSLSHWFGFLHSLEYGAIYF